MSDEKDRDELREIAKTAGKHMNKMYARELFLTKNDPIKQVILFHKKIKGGLDDTGQ